MLSKWGFHLPVRLEFGRGYAANIGRFTAEAAAQRGISCSASTLLVGYRDCPALAKTYKKAADSLGAAGFAVAEYFDVEPEPDEGIIRRGAELARRQGIGIVVGLGGGSVLDAAKGIAAWAVNDQSSLWEHSMANKDSRPIEQALPIAAIPTTAGTGAEATAVAVFKQQGMEVLGATAGLSSSVQAQSRKNTAGQASSGAPFQEAVKTIIYGPALLPMLAVVDADFYDSVPCATAAACGADALSHSIEVITSRLANPVSSSLAVESVRLLVENLVAAVDRQQNHAAKAVKRAREAVTLATLLSGMAVHGPGATAAHAVAHALGAILDIPHGEAVAMAALPFLRFNAEACGEEYAKLERLTLRQDAPCGFVEQLENIWRELNLPRHLPRHLPRQYKGCLAEEREKLVGRLADNAADGSPLMLRNNLRRVERAELERIIAEIVR